MIFIVIKRSIAFAFSNSFSYELTIAAMLYCFIIQRNLIMYIDLNSCLSRNKDKFVCMDAGSTKMSS